MNSVGKTSAVRWALPPVHTEFATSCDNDDDCNEGEICKNSLCRKAGKRVAERGAAARKAAESERAVEREAAGAAAEASQVRSREDLVNKVWVSLLKEGIFFLHMYSAINHHIDWCQSRDIVGEENIIREFKQKYDYLMRWNPPLQGLIEGTADKENDDDLFFYDDYMHPELIKIINAAVERYEREAIEAEVAAKEKQEEEEDQSWVGSRLTDLLPARESWFVPRTTWLPTERAKRYHDEANRTRATAAAADLFAGVDALRMMGGGDRKRKSRKKLKKTNKRIQKSKKYRKKTKHKQKSKKSKRRNR
jgi:hypothetical protein